MNDKSTTNETLKQLEAIFTKHANDRICVLGTMCCGKTTMLSKLPNCVDMDSALGPLLTENEMAFICQTPWTTEIGNEVDRLVKERIKIAKDSPMYGTVIVDCEVVVYLDIENDLLQERCKKRGADFTDALNLKEDIERDVENHKAKNEKVFYYLKVTE